MNISNNHLYQSKFSELLIGVKGHLYDPMDSTPLIKDPILYFKEMNRPEIVESLEYLHEVERIYNNLVVTFHESLICIDMIKKDEFIDNPEMVKFFLRDWILRSATITEVLYVLSNKVFKLGFKEEKGFIKKVKQALESDSRNTKHLFSEVDRFAYSSIFEEKLSYRNIKIKHRAELENKELDNLIHLRLAASFGFIDPIFYQFDQILAGRTISTYLEGKSKDLQRIVTDFLDNIVEEFEKGLNPFMSYRSEI